MPQATPELQAEWQDDTTAENYLFERGCKLLRSWDWVVPDEPGLTAKMYRALQYMAQEWDYGGWYFQNEYDKAVAEGQIDKDGKKIKKDKADD